MRRCAINCLRKIAYTLRQPTPYSLGFIILITCQYALYIPVPGPHDICVHFGCHFGRCPGLTSSVAPVASAVRTLLQILGSRPEEIRLAATHHLKVSPFESARAHMRAPSHAARQARRRARPAGARSNATPRQRHTSIAAHCTGRRYARPNKLPMRQTSAASPTSSARARVAVCGSVPAPASPAMPPRRTRRRTRTRTRRRRFAAG